MELSRLCHLATEYCNQIHLFQSIAPPTGLILFEDALEPLSDLDRKRAFVTYHLEIARWVIHVC